MLQGEATHLRTLAEQKLGFMGGGEGSTQPWIGREAGWNQEELGEG